MHRAMLLALGAGCASSPAAPGHLDPSAPLSGEWVVTLTPPTRGELAIRMRFASGDDGRWSARSREGAVREIVGWRRYTLGRLLRRIPDGGAMAYVEDGRLRRRGDTTIVSGRLVSLALGRWYVAGIVRDGTLRGELRTDSLGPAVGRITATPLASDAPLRDYPLIARRVRQEIERNIYDPEVARRPEWVAFYDQLEGRFGRARDDADAMLSFYALTPRLGLSHLNFIRDPVLATTPLDSLPSLATTPPDSQLTLAFPAPGVAYLAVRRWDRMTRIVDGAFRQIDSARSTTLILDVRDNPGGDHSSMSPLTHLIRDSLPAGVFLGNKWYRTRRTPPAPGERTSLPILSRDAGMALIHHVRNDGGVVGIVPPLAPYFGGSVYLLVSRRTASASEPLASLLSTSRRATLIGERTAGAMLSALPHDVGQGFVVVVPEADYFTAQGIRLEGRGVDPDVGVPATDALVAAAQRVASPGSYTRQLLLGWAQASRGLWPQADSAYRAAEAIAPDSTAPVAGRARALQELARWEEAFALYDRLLSRAPVDPGVHYQVGRTAALSGQRLRQGEQSLRRYLERTPPRGQPSSASAQWRLGQILVRGGDVEGGRRAYRAALELDPAHGPARAGLAALPAAEVRP